MTRSHNGYNDEELQSAVGSEASQEAAHTSGFSNLDDLTANAPEKEGFKLEPPDEKPKRKGRLTKEEKEIAETQEVLTREVLRSLATDPWTFLSIALGEPTAVLTPEEADKLAAAYFECAKRMGIAFENRLWFLWIVGRLNLEIANVRMPIFKKHFPTLFGTEKETNIPKEKEKQ